MSCNSVLDAAPTRTQPTYPHPMELAPRESGPSEPRRFAPPSIGFFGHPGFLFLVLMWAIATALATARTIYADENVTERIRSTQSSVKQSSLNASKAATSPVSYSIPRKAAPKLQVAAWYDQSGPATPPLLKGKVQLVVFWGVNCPACVRKIPQVRHAATRYAESDLVVIGLHNAQVSPSRLQRFARDRGLNYPLAIDRSASSRYSFGLTTDAYQVQAIPHAAVIDRDGSLSYVGSFEQALQTAEALLNVTSG